MNSVGLVLEGGGMRGVYTAGVLEYMMEHELYFPYVIGVSAGACNAASYLSRQNGRNRKVLIDYVNHPEYISYKNLFRKKQLFGMDLIFNEIPSTHVPFDFDAFQNATEQFVIGTTDITTGKPYYFNKKDDGEQILSILRASSSLPFMAPPVQINNRFHLDGGITDPIPVQKSEADGNKSHVVVLTRNEGYRKQKSKLSWMIQRLYRKNPALAKAITTRYVHYNQTLDHIEANRENYFIIQPSSPLEVARIEKSQLRLTTLYNQGYEEMKSHHKELEAWLEKRELAKETV
ncbi:patatin-like phospholipase family protein [Guptibacillus hwajinpoensis]|uniref:patatin-like phospholipase family protein n=1 Tax=Guptibacillus hwajinpoensis TaxID=208199 RepID=UPI0024B34B0B|nr:patatin family protein [Pseudalkalibacillus hwajinpoensis]